MRQIDFFTLTDSHRKKDKKMLISKKDKPLSIDVDGLRIDAQFELSDGRYLVWLSEKCPYDEMLSIYLIGPNGTVEDSVEAGARFGLGPGGVLQVIDFDDNWVDFEFFSDDSIARLEISPQQRRFRSLPNSWRYKNFLKKHKIIVREMQKGGE